MISIPLQFTIVYISIGLVVSTFAMMSDNMKMQHEIAMDSENIPQEFRTFMLVFLSLAYVMFWPAIIAQL